MRNNKINIPNPCSEDWNKMIPNKDGRHCSHCNKTVVDFTKMSTTEIYQHINNSSDNGGCGYFKTTQTTLPIPFFHRYLILIQDFVDKKLKPYFFRKTLLSLIGLIMLLSGCKTRQRTGGTYLSNKEHRKIEAVNVINN